MPADERSTAGNVSHALRRCRCHQLREGNSLAGWSCIFLPAAGKRVAAATHSVEKLCFIVNNLTNLRVSHGLSITYESGQAVL